LPVLSEMTATTCIMELTTTAACSTAALGVSASLGFLCLVTAGIARGCPLLLLSFRDIAAALCTTGTSRKLAVWVLANDDIVCCGEFCFRPG
jgi:hypothetical protein